MNISLRACVLCLFILSVFSCTPKSTETSAPQSKTPEKLRTLHLTQDEKSLERQIAAYLKAEYDFTSSTHQWNKDPEDEYLSVPFAVENAPDITFIVDSNPSARDGQERCIRIYADFEYEMTPSNSQYVTALTILNSFMEEKWMPQRVFFRPNGDLRLENYINIVGAENPLPTEQVADILIRNVNTWKSLYQELKAKGIHRL